MPLTEQERLLLRLVHKDDPVELAMLDSKVRDLQELEDKAEFQRFFGQSTKQASPEQPMTEQAMPEQSTTEEATPGKTGTEPSVLEQPVPQESVPEQPTQPQAAPERVGPDRSTTQQATPKVTRTGENE
jgi:hypothetical protein